jgi:hypothetical protein
MAKNLLPPIPQDQISEVISWREWFRNLGNYIQVAQTGGSPWTIVQGGTGAGTAAGARANLGIGTMGTQNANAVTISGGAITNTTFDNLTHITTRNHNDLQNIQGGTTNQYYHLTSAQSASTGGLTDYIEAYDTSSSIALTATPTLLKPASTGSSSGITYSSSTGVFTFPDAGNYSLSLAVNAIASASGQFVYIYAENNTGSGWTTNTNSGKYYSLPNGVATQVVYSQSVHRSAGQQVRYWIYSNSNKVSLTTTSLPSSTAVVPAIRVQYS